MEGYGAYLGMEKGCFIVKDRKGKVERYPLLENEIKEVVRARYNAPLLRNWGFGGYDVSPDRDLDGSLPHR